MAPNRLKLDNYAGAALGRRSMSFWQVSPFQAPIVTCHAGAPGCLERLHAQLDRCVLSLEASCKYFGLSRRKS
jgi:hypothetical protein